jgi:hypothetical protein
LYRHGVTRAHLMPTLDSATATIAKMSKCRGGGWTPHAPTGDVRLDGTRVTVVCRRCRETVPCDGSGNSICKCLYRWSVKHTASAARVSQSPSLSPNPD